MHALVRERQNGYLQIAGRNCFNSRPYARSDPKTNRVHTHIIDVSIHAPVRERLYMSCFTGGRWTFQFTLPRRERRFMTRAISQTTRRFNSRSREGSDQRKLRDLPIDEAGFNSRSREGSDLPFYRRVFLTHRFNSRSREGSDTAVCVITDVVRFQFTLPRRERLHAHITHET